MAWKYDQPGILYDQTGGLLYDGGVFGRIKEWIIRARHRGHR